ncbi:MAG TPA: hypothetical protein VKT77_16135 [Chthonomonadaceae bacterium]|nr:hypothetical protein [Chthonomonadaceae bacterium]
MTFPQPVFEAARVLTSETRRETLIRLSQATPRFLQGVYPFAGRGIFDLAPLHDDLAYRVPEGYVAEIVYLRAGNASDDLICLALTVYDRPSRYFPLGPKSDSHVELAIVESHAAGTRIAVCFAAPRGVSGAVVVDVGMLEIHGGARS